LVKKYFLVVEIWQLEEASKCITHTPNLHQNLWKIDVFLPFVGTQSGFGVAKPHWHELLWWYEVLRKL
jgi:hypothetical protein